MSDERRGGREGTKEGKGIGLNIVSLQIIKSESFIVYTSKGSPAVFDTSHRAAETQRLQSNGVTSQFLPPLLLRESLLSVGDSRVKARCSLTCLIRLKILSTRSHDRVKPV